MKQFYWSLDKIKAYFQARLMRYNKLTEDNLSYLLEYELILKRDLDVPFTEIFKPEDKNLSELETLMVNTVINQGNLEDDFVKISRKRSRKHSSNTYKEKMKVNWSNNLVQYLNEDKEVVFVPDGSTEVNNESNRVEN